MKPKQENIISAWHIWCWLNVTIPIFLMKNVLQQSACFAEGTLLFLYILPHFSLSISLFVCITLDCTFISPRRNRIDATNMQYILLCAVMQRNLVDVVVIAFAFAFAIAIFLFSRRQLHFVLTNRFTLDFNRWQSLLRLHIRCFKLERVVCHDPTSSFVIVSRICRTQNEWWMQITLPSSSHPDTSQCHHHVFALCFWLYLYNTRSHCTHQPHA